MSDDLLHESPRPMGILERTFPDGTVKRFEIWTVTEDPPGSGHFTFTGFPLEDDAQ